MAAACWQGNIRPDSMSGSRERGFDSLTAFAEPIPPFRCMHWRMSWGPTSAAVQILNELLGEAVQRRPNHSIRA